MILVYLGRKFCTVEIGINALQNIYKMCNVSVFLSAHYLVKLNTTQTRNTFCGTWYLPHSRVHKSIAELCSNFGDSAIIKGQIAYFSLRMRQTALFLLPDKNLTSPTCSPTPISYNTGNFGDSAINTGQIAYFLLRMRKTALFLLPVKNLTSPSCSPTPISYDPREFWWYVNI